MAGIHDVAKGLGIKDEQVHALFANILTATAGGDRVYIKGFGTFNSKTRKARTIKSPQLPTGEAFVPERNVLVFKPSPETRGVLNGEAPAETPTPAPAPAPAPKAAAPAKPATKPAAAKPAAAAPAAKPAAAKPAPAKAVAPAAKPAAAKPAAKAKPAPAPEPEPEEQEVADDGDAGEVEYTEE